jgi:hypothetical protein
MYLLSLRGLYAHRMLTRIGCCSIPTISSMHLSRHSVRSISALTSVTNAPHSTTFCSVLRPNDRFGECSTCVVMGTAAVGDTLRRPRADMQLSCAAHRVLRLRTILVFNLEVRVITEFAFRCSSIRRTSVFLYLRLPHFKHRARLPARLQRSPRTVTMCRPHSQRDKTPYISGMKGRALAMPPYELSLITIVVG